MDQDYITRREHEEFARRMDIENERIKDENARQNKRIANVEESVNEFNKLALQIEKIALSIQQMTEEISKQGERLENIESKPGKRSSSAFFVLRCGSLCLSSSAPRVRAR